MSNDQIRLNTLDRSDDQMMEIDLMPSDGRSAHYAIASVVVRMDGQASDSPDLVSFAERLVSRYNACAGMSDPTAEIAELKRQRDELLAVLEGLLHNSSSPYSGDPEIDADFERRYRTISESAISAITKAKGSSS